MGGAVAPQALEVHRILHAPRRPPIDGVTRLICTLVDPESLATEREHFWHERKRIQRASGIERTKNLLFAPNLDELADAQIENRIHGGGYRRRFDGPHCTPRSEPFKVARGRRGAK
jgi:hypothetical protein